jgi:hypothetical protein
MVRLKNGHCEKESIAVAFVVQGRCIEGESFVVRHYCRWKEKSDEEAKKKQIFFFVEGDFYFKIRTTRCSKRRGSKSKRRGGVLDRERDKEREQNEIST